MAEEDQIRQQFDAAFERAHNYPRRSEVNKILEDVIETAQTRLAIYKGEQDNGQNRTNS